ncbi:putative RDD family membrane protein YckC [Streptacidiphilus sp. MAP12-33]|uniref:RDD family protein n=1 Tax=Streptacidiphilus sp. MAP12-33 TaxID=3156266 RepID=UPI003511811C
MTVQPPAERPAPGYYPDPSIPGFVRYWDGDAWTPGSARPAPQDGAPLPPPPRTGARGGLRVAPPPPPRPAAVEETGPVFLDETGAAQLVVPARQAPDGGAVSVWGASPQAQPGLLDTGMVPRSVTWGVPGVPAVPEPAGQAPLVQDDPDEELASALRLALSQTRRAQLPPPAQYETDSWTTPPVVPTWAPAPPPAVPPAVLEQPPFPRVDAEPASWTSPAPVAPEESAGERPVPFGDAVPTAAPPYEAPTPWATAAAPAPSRGLTPPPVAPREAAPAAWVAADSGPVAPVGFAGDGVSAPSPGVKPPLAAPASWAALAGRAVEEQPSSSGVRATAASAPASAPAPAPVSPSRSADASTGAAPASWAATAAAAAPAAPVQAEERPSVPSHGAAPAARVAPPEQVAAPEAKPPVRRVGLPAREVAGATEAGSARRAAPERAGRAASGVGQRRPKGTRPALLGPRIGARLVDALVTYALVGVLGVVLVQRVTLHLQAKVEAARASGVPQTVWLVDGTVLADAGLLLAALLLVGVLYETIPVAVWGRTLGKAVFGLTVIDVRTKSRPRLARTFLRTALCQTLVFLLLGILELVPCATDRKFRQSWHDKLGGTYVVKR